MPGRKYRECKDCIQIFANIATVIIAIAAVASPWFIYRQSSRQFEETIDHGDKQFELINRSFIELIMPDISMLNADLNRNKYPEIKFKIVINFVNHGKLPAHVKSVDCLFVNTKDNTKRCLAMLYAKDRQWGNFDVFPYIGYPFQEKIGPPINITNIRDVMGISNIFVQNIISKDSDFWKKDIGKIRNELLSKADPFFIIFQIEYYKMSSGHQKTEPYFYSVKFKFHNKLECEGFIESKTGDTERKGKWYKIGPVGQIKEI